MRITERRLRSIIRETLLEEQNRIDEGQTLNAIKAAALAAGLTLSATQLVTFTNYLAGGGNSGGVSDPLTGSPYGARGHKMTAAEEAELDAFIKNPTLGKLPRMIELTNKLYMSFGAGRQGKTPGEDPYKGKLKKAAAAIKTLQDENPDDDSAAMYSLD